MNTARKGNGKELRTAALLEDEGWLVGSRRHVGGAGDLLAVQAGVSLLVEVKATAAGPFTHFGPADRVALLEAAERVGARPVLAWWRPRARTHELIFQEQWPRSRPKERNGGESQPA